MRDCGKECCVKYLICLAEEEVCFSLLGQVDHIINGPILSRLRDLSLLMWRCVSLLKRILGWSEFESGLEVILLRREEEVRRVEDVFVGFFREGELRLKLRCVHVENAIATSLVVVGRGRSRH